MSVRAAWRKYPPLAGAASSPGAAVAGLDATVDRALAALVEANSAAIAARLVAVEQRLAKAPADPLLLNERAFVLVSAGRLDDALTLVRPVADKDLALKLTLANVLTLQGELKDAEKLLVDAKPTERDAASAYLFNVAIIRFLAGSDARAAESPAGALAIDPAAAAAMGEEGAETRSDEKCPPVVLKADLLALLKKARDRSSKRVTTPAPQVEARGSPLVAGRRGADPGSRTLVAQTLRWLVAARAQ